MTGIVTTVGGGLDSVPGELGDPDTSSGAVFCLAPLTLMAVVAPELAPPLVSRQNTKAMREPPAGKVYRALARPADTVIGPASAKSTYKRQAWIEALEETLAESATGIPAVAVVGLTSLIVGLAKAMAGNKKKAERVKRARAKKVIAESSLAHP